MFAIIVRRSPPGAFGRRETPAVVAGGRHDGFAMTDARRRATLDHPRYPRSGGYDPEWVIADMTGPHPLWLMEALTQQLRIVPPMRVLDLGCGKALTSVAGGRSPRRRARRWTAGR